MAGASSADGTPVQLYDGTGSAAQRWTVGSDGTGGGNQKWTAA